MLHHPTNNFWGNASTAAENSSSEQRDKCALFSTWAKPFTQGPRPCFYFASSDFISQSSHQSQKSNKDDWLHFITAGFIFHEDLQVQPDNTEEKKRERKKKIGEICRTINPVWCVLLKLRYSVEQLKTVNSLVLLLLHKRIRQLICITAHIYSNLSSSCVRCCSASSRCCYPSQQAGSGSLPPPAASSDTGKTCFTLDLCHYPTPASQGNRGIKAGQEKSCPHT